MVIKIISILLIYTPILYLLLFYVFKSNYIGYVLKIIYLITFILSIFLMFIKIDSSFVLFICNLIALSLLVSIERVYNYVLNKFLAPIISQLTDANVISKVVVTSKNILTLTTKGYATINYDICNYKINNDIQEFSESEQKILLKLKKFNG